MAVDAKTRDAIERARGGLETMTVEECHECAAFMREYSKSLTTAQKREIAERVALSFERRAAAHASRQAPS